MRLRNGVHKYKAYVQPAAEYIGLFRAVNDIAPELVYISRTNDSLRTSFLWRRKRHGGMVGHVQPVAIRVPGDIHVAAFHLDNVSALYRLRHDRE